MRKSRFSKVVRASIAVVAVLSCAVVVGLGFLAGFDFTPSDFFQQAAEGVDVEESIRIAGGADGGGGLGAPSTPALNSPQDDPARYESGYVLAMVADDSTADAVAEAVASTPGLSELTVANSAGNMVKFALPEGMSVEHAVSLIANAEGVAAAQPNYRYYTQGDSPSDVVKRPSASSPGLVAAVASSVLATQAVAANDPKKSRQWALSSMKVPAAWNTVAKLGASNKYVGVAVLDSGFLTTHEDLKNVIVKSYNAFYGTSNVGYSYYADDLTHGTHVAGIIAAQANNGKGVAGVAYNAGSFATCKLLPIQVANRSGFIYSDVLISAYDWLKKNASTYNVRVVNVSLGNDPGEDMNSYDILFGHAINSLWNDGIVTVAAAGNSSGFFTNLSYGCWPSDLPNVVGVVNLEQSSNSDGVVRSSSSNYNTSSQKKKDISAPGTDILSTYSTSKSSYELLTGTSMAAPAVAGVLALEFKANPKLTAPEATSKLFSSARDLTQSSGTSVGWDRQTGYGEANASAAVASTTPYLSGSTQLSKGKKSQLKVKIDNKVQTAKTWKWTSSSTAIATVSATGLVTAKAAGDVVITATKGGKTACQTLTVTSGKTHVTSLSVSVANQVYTGSAHKPAPVVRDGSVALVKGKHYKVSYSNNKNPGKATVKVTGISPYTGSTTETFTIKPKGTRVTKLTGASKRLTVRWAKQDKQTTGYQVQVATDKAFTKNKKTVRKANPKATSTAISSLKAKTRYYVRIRTYKTVNGKTYYSAWSATKSSRTK